MILIRSSFAKCICLAFQLVDRVRRCACLLAVCSAITNLSTPHFSRSNHIASRWLNVRFQRLLRRQSTAREWNIIGPPVGDPRDAALALALELHYFYSSSLTRRLRRLNTTLRLHHRLLLDKTSLMINVIRELDPLTYAKGVHMNSTSPSVLNYSPRLHPSCSFCLVSLRLSAHAR